MDVALQSYSKNLTISAIYGRDVNVDKNLSIGIMAYIAAG